MPGEAWTALGVLAAAVVTYLLAPLVAAWIDKRRTKTPAPIEAPPAPDLFREKWLARIDELEEEVTTERSAKVECLVRCARLKTELRLAAKQRTSDEETIKRLRERVDRLERIVRGAHE